MRTWDTGESVVATGHWRAPALDWMALAVVSGVHLTALAARSPRLFSRRRVGLVVVGSYLFGTCLRPCGRRDSTLRTSG